MPSSLFGFSAASILTCTVGMNIPCVSGTFTSEYSMKPRDRRMIWPTLSQQKYTESLLGRKTAPDGAWFDCTSPCSIFVGLTEMTSGVLAIQCVLLWSFSRSAAAVVAAEIRKTCLDGQASANGMESDRIS